MNAGIVSITWRGNSVIGWRSRYRCCCECSSRGRQSRSSPGRSPRIRIALRIGGGDTRSRSKPDDSPDIHGSMLWSTPTSSAPPCRFERNRYHVYVRIRLSLVDFFSLMFVETDINDVGSTSLALFAESNPNYDEVEASKRQVAQVSTLSVGNFVGRLLLGDGPISDLIRNQFRPPRAYCLCIVSSLFVVSQALAIEISSIRTLWVETALLGVAYGGLFGALPTIVIDWFGLE